ncbi:hypothetical protein JTB14_032595 [Gonioctena quinquepunctata]|nr:hypothetical protein JTB14_032595 [Gonioctena quinquepunctata]
MKYCLNYFLILTYISWTIAKKVPSPPYIVKQPPSDEVLFQVKTNGENNEPFYIECEAIGEPTPSYYWMKNGKPFEWQTYHGRISQLTGRGTLSITKPSDVDVGQYQCFAENQYGVATSNSVFMRKAELNSFKASQPLILTGNEGDPFNLTCQPPDGWPKPIVHWIKVYGNSAFRMINSSRMTLDPEGNLWFSNLTIADVTDKFMYACAATSSTKYDYKFGNRVLLNVMSSGVSSSQNKHEPVLQWSTRKNEVAYRGKKAELFCIFGGTPLPQTVWKKGSRLVQSSNRITQGNYGKSLIIKVVDFEDEGTYTCEVSNGVGESKSFSINLDVQAVPYFTREPEVVNATEDDKVELFCEAGGEPEPAIKWIHNGKPIEQSPYNPRRKVFPNKIMIERLLKNDTGNYGCNATNSIGYAYKDVYVNVLALTPEITDSPRDIWAVVNQNVNFTCKVLGAPKPIIKWLHNEKELIGSKYYIEPSGALHISHVSFNDQGNYTCYAENKLGNTSINAKLDVKAHTYITDGPKDFEVEARSPVTFRCNAVADESLDLEILWLKNDQPIDFDGEPRFVKSSDKSLTITKTIQLDSGTYTCLARTEIDEASAKAQLIVQDVPNSPWIIGVECHTKDATISWTPTDDNHAPISYFIIQYNTSFTPEDWKDVFSHVPSADRTYNVPMSPWANYTFRVIAVNKIGPSTPSWYSDVCTTSPEVPYKNPDNVKGEGDRPDNLVITWTPMLQIEHNGPGFKYRVYWKRNIPGKDYEYREILDYKQDSFVISNQLSYQQYRIKIIAVNELGETIVSPQEVIGYSGEDLPEKAPTNFTLVDIVGPTTALLSWDPVPLDSVRGNFKGYKMKIWSKTFPIPKEIQFERGSTEAWVTYFDTYTTNYAQIYVFNGQYDGPASEILSFDTPEGIPEGMQDLDAIPLGSSAFLLKWKKPDKPNGILTGYNIYFSEVDFRMRVNQPIPRNRQITDPNQKRAKLGGLKPGRKYRLFISATTNAGESRRYFIERETKPAGSYKPSKPSFDWEIVKPGPPTTVKVYWLPNKDENTGSHFFIKYKKKGESDYLSTDPETSEDFLEVVGLDGEAVYDFIVTSVEGQNYEDSDAQEVRT